jgi:hypothetical protein
VRKMADPLALALPDVDLVELKSNFDTDFKKFGFLSELKCLADKLYDHPKLKRIADSCVGYVIDGKEQFNALTNERRFKIICGSTTYLNNCDLPDLKRIMDNNATLFDMLTTFYAKELHLSVKAKECLGHPKLLHVVILGKKISKVKRDLIREDHIIGAISFIVKEYEYSLLLYLAVSGEKTNVSWGVKEVKEQYSLSCF